MIIKKLKTINNSSIDCSSAYLKIAHLDRPFIMTFEHSDEYGQINNFTYVGASPLITLKCDSNGTYISSNKNIVNAELTIPKDPFEAIDCLLEKLKQKEANNPFPFSGGAVGYFSYDLKNIIEKEKFKDQTPTDIPLMDLGFYDTIFVYNHNKDECYLVSNGMDKSGETFSTMSTLIENTKQSNVTSPEINFGTVKSNMTKEEYINKINKVKSYIEDGDIYQINISQMFTIPITTENSSFYSLYEKLTNSHRSTFSSYLDLGSFQIISNTPERLLSIEKTTKGRTITTEPIKGTIERGTTTNKDNELKVLLKGNSKECAEHVMIVDLERNDLGKICNTSTVTVTEFQTIKTYPNLHHMVSTVKGELREEITAGDVLREMFPGGSITGAPKVRAMEIIEELEPNPRGIYTGGIGYINLNGTMDISMAIRTAVIKDNALHLHVGGGIVADSTSEKEYEETTLKAKDYTDLIEKITKEEKQRPA